MPLFDDTSAGPRRAVFAALADGDPERAMRLAERHLPVLISHDPGVVLAACEAAPPALLAATGRWAALERYVAHLLAEQGKPPIFPDVATAPHRAVAPADRLAVMTGHLVALRTLARYADAAALAREARALSQRLDPEDRAVIAPHLATLMVQWGQALASAGEIPEAVEALAEAASEAARVGNARAGIEAAGDLSWILALMGAGSDADDWLARHDALAERCPRVTRVRSGADLARAQRALDRLDLGGGLAALGVAEPRAEELGVFVAALRALARARNRDDAPLAIRAQLEVALSTVPEPRVGSGLPGAAVTIARATLPALGGLHESALDALDACPEVAAPARALVATRRGASLVALGDADRAYASVSRLTSSPFPRIAVEALAVRAAALTRRGNAVSGAADFRRAAELAEANGIRAALTTLPAPDLAVLVARADAPQLRHLIAASGVLVPPPASPRPRLTRQQLAALRALAATGTLQAASASLGVSANTAKTHLRETYRRLGATTRDEALAEGRRRGLI
ncbi:helix-turn-helix transcriptional regulator [Microbacterium excoecariae]|uniref:helix-turn-helix transcriptional regulator n=1 Tax=Microbacterium excoecariae TaxID=2715210 RepID=UPI00140C538C|nr:helix-turn-helix transcriptional regulator [Microbacterium excoecariae]NHI16431.1 helix-turn-helix transcriptional regulator [Microbacterium excoecariae]